jgi:hypothetical protein
MGVNFLDNDNRAINISNTMEYYQHLHFRQVPILNLGSRKLIIMDEI